MSASSICKEESCQSESEQIYLQLLDWLPKFRDEIGRRQDQDEAAANEHYAGQLHVLVELDIIEEDITDGRGGDGGDQAEGDEVFVSDEDTQVSQHVGG